MNKKGICSIKGCNNKADSRIVKNGDRHFKDFCSKHKYTDSLYTKKRSRRCSWKFQDINITFKEYEELLKQQNGVCKICGGTNRSGKALSVDHDHKTGKIRGLLCIWCNSRLDRFEIWDWFQKAELYLNNNK